MEQRHPALPLPCRCGFHLSKLGCGCVGTKYFVRSMCVWVCVRARVRVCMCAFQGCHNPQPRLFRLLLFCLSLSLSLTSPRLPPKAGKQSPCISHGLAASYEPLLSQFVATVCASTSYIPGRATPLRHTFAGPVRGTRDGAPPPHHRSSPDLSKVAVWRGLWCLSWREEGREGHGLGQGRSDKVRSTKYCLNHGPGTAWPFLQTLAVAGSSVYSVGGDGLPIHRWRRGGTVLFVLY